MSMSHKEFAEKVEQLKSSSSVAGGKDIWAKPMHFSYHDLKKVMIETIFIKNLDLCSVMFVIVIHINVVIWMKHFLSDRRFGALGSEVY